MRDSSTWLQSITALMSGTARNEGFSRKVVQEFGREPAPEEIAEKLELPEGTVKSRINRGRTELARQIQKLREQQDAIPRTGVSG